MDLPIIPKFEVTKPSRNAGVKYRPPVEKKKLEDLKKAREEEERKMHELKLMEIKAESKKIKKNDEKIHIRIAPKEFSNFTEKQMELLIRHQLKKYPQLLKNRKYLDINPNYKHVEEKVLGPKIVAKKNISKKAVEKELE